MARLHSDPVAPRRLRLSARAAEVPEIRLLLQIIAGVYERLNRLGATQEDAYANVTSLLASAYAAEMRSSSCAAASMSERLEIARAKSTLPFAIIDAIGALRRHENGSKKMHDDLVHDIGTIFWLTDDLVDLIGDSRSGALNAILVKATGGQSLDLGASLRCLLENRAIEDAAATICDAVVRVPFDARTRAPPGSWHRPSAVRAWRFWLDDRITRLESLAVLSAAFARSPQGTCTGTW